MLSGQKNLSINGSRGAAPRERPGRLRLPPWLLSAQTRLENHGVDSSK